MTHNRHNIQNNIVFISNARYDQFRTYIDSNNIKYGKDYDYNSGESHMIRVDMNGGRMWGYRFRGLRARRGG